MKIARGSNYNMTLVLEASHKQNHCGNYKAALTKNLPTLRNDSSFVVQFSNSVSKTRATLLFMIKIIEMLELHASTPPMRSAEYQAKIRLKFLIIIHNYMNV